MDILVEGNVEGVGENSNKNKKELGRFNEDVVNAGETEQCGK